ncbi:MAG: Calx-beta domain-containing protein [Planctomycetota bacterium]|jgi:hypothetical protein
MLSFVGFHRHCRVLILAGAVITFSTTAVSAATIPVEASLVEVNADGQCSLIEAFTNALDTGSGQPYTDCVAGDPAGADTVVLANAATYLLNNADNATAGGNALPAITGDVTVDGNQSVLERTDGAPGFRHFLVATGGALSVNDLSMRNGSPTGFSRQGGAIRNYGTLNLSGCSLESNTGSLGGAIFTVGDMTITDCTFDGNMATVSGGALFNNTQANVAVNRSTFSNNVANANGGAVYDTGLTLMMTASTFTDNSALGGDGGALCTSGTTTMENCTLSTNNGDAGGGLFVDTGGDASLSGCTLFMNDPSNIRLLSSSSQVTLDNNIIGTAMSQADCVAGSGSVNDLGFNLVEDGSCIGHPDSFAGNPGLGPLQDNGGLTPTHALTAASDAVDSGSCMGDPEAVDQRGMARPQGNGCDVGSFELGHATVSVAGANAVESDGAVTFTITRSHNVHAVTMDVVAENGTSESGSDFEPLDQSVTMPANGSLSVDVTVTLLDDDVVELDESLDLVLSNVSNGVLAEDRATAGVENDDSIDVSFAEDMSTAEEADGTHDVAVTMSGATDIPLTVSVLDDNSGTAQADVDYHSVGTQQLTFPAGSVNETTVVVTVDVLDDDETETDESVVLLLQSLTDPNVNVAMPDSHTVTISDDDEMTEMAGAFMDAMPRTCPNTFPARRGGVLNVALLGSGEFDVSMVDLSSLRLARADGVGGHVKPKRQSRLLARLRDVGSPARSEGCECQKGERDRIDDVNLKFNARLLTQRLELREVPDDSYVEVRLEGFWHDGTPFEAFDCLLVRNGNDVSSSVLASTTPSFGNAQSDKDVKDKSGPNGLTEPPLACGTFSPACLLVVLLGLAPAKLRRSRRRRRADDAVH